MATWSVAGMSGSTVPNPPVVGMLKILTVQEAPAKRQDYLPASIKLITSDLDDDLPPSDPRTRQEDTEEEFEMDSDSEIADYNRVISLFTRD
ncbi:hypothetical protein M422DRAFT_255150 [Sphaerobolus stellatus SS14]|uniref:Uncharacterized protein n=1 Tax=Sphaerobolus stellatus (strain SS14) TaxID=990650 RepID=A0A0C9VJN6_SPHS4|nr:hypothetical protein M422DRAFT_255150 [Sphaerobolus stellatus SS14]